MKRLWVWALLVSLSGCADAMLDEEEERVFTGGGKVLQPVGLYSAETAKVSPGTLSDAARAANHLSEGYYQAAIRAQKTQDAASGLVIVTAASVVGGAMSGTSDAALANRGVAAVGVQQAASRGIGRTTIQSLFDGSQTLNCVGGMATVYGRDDVLRNDRIAAEITLAVIREIRIAVRRGLTREVADYATVVTAFEAAIPSGQPSLTNEGPSMTLNAGRQGQNQATVEKLLEYLARLQGCVTSKALSQAGKTASDAEGN